MVKGKSGPYKLPALAFRTTGEAVPYGDPSTLPQKMKNLSVSKARPGPNNGPHLVEKFCGELFLMNE